MLCYYPQPLGAPVTVSSPLKSRLAAVLSVSDACSGRTVDIPQIYIYNDNRRTEHEIFRASGLMTVRHMRLRFRLLLLEQLRPAGKRNNKIK